MGAIVAAVIGTVLSSVISKVISGKDSSSQQAADIPAPTTVETKPGPAIADSQRKARAAAAARKGQSSTILTSPLGLTDEDGASSTLLGG